MNISFVTVTTPNTQVGDSIRITEIYNMCFRDQIQYGMEVFLNLGNKDACFVQISGSAILRDMVVTKVFNPIELVQYIDLLEGDYSQESEQYVLKLANICEEARDELKHKITKESLMVDWVKNFGDADYFLPKIKTSVASLRWVQTIGYEESLKSNIDNSYDAFIWARRFPNDADYMKQHVVDGDDALRWASGVGNKEDMAKLVTTGYQCIRWSNIFPEDCALMKSKITTPKHAYEWMKDFGDVDYMLAIIGTDKTYQKLANAWISKTKDKAQKILDLLSRVN